MAGGAVEDKTMMDRSEKQRDIPEISVIMGIHNERYPGAVRHAVDSILSQEGVELELILYDDGSDPDVVREIASLAEKDRRIILAGEGEQRGLAYSLNACLAYARAPLLARMDADDVALPQRLKKERDYLKRHPDIDWVGCNAGIYDEQGEWGHSTRPEDPGTGDYLRYSPFIHPTVMFRRRVLQEVGGYDTGEKAQLLEDYELFLRLWRKGHRGANLQEELLLYYIDRGHYHIRGWKQRVNEMKLRYTCYLRSGVLFPAGWLYGLRPIAGALIPAQILRRMKERKRQL